MPRKVKVPSLPLRAARLLMGASTLRRTSDRIEGVVAVLLSAAFLVALIAGSFAGWRFFQAQTAQSAQLHPAVAVLSSSGVQLPPDESAARWRAPDGRPMSGILTTEMAPDVWGGQPGDRVQVYLTARGAPVPAPPGRTAITLTAVVLGTAEAGGGGILLIICYLLCRMLLDRRRLAGWESDWELTGPRWTMRR